MKRENLLKYLALCLTVVAAIFFLVFEIIVLAAKVEHLWMLYVTIGLLVVAAALVIYLIVAKKKEKQQEAVKQEEIKAKEEKAKEEAIAQEDRNQREYKRLSEMGIKVSEKVNIPPVENGRVAIGIIQNKKGKVYLFGPKDEQLNIGDVVEIKDLGDELKAVPVVVPNQMFANDRIVEPFRDIERVLYRADANKAKEDAERKAQEEAAKKAAEEEAARKAAEEEAAKKAAEEEAARKAAEEEAARKAAEEEAARKAAEEEAKKAAEEEAARKAAEEEAARKAAEEEAARKAAEEEAARKAAEEEAARREAEALSLKQSMALAKATASKHEFTKKYIANYLKEKQNVEVNERENFTSTGLPLADTHYVEGPNGRKCFTYIYETEGSIIILAKMKDEYANELKNEHSQVNLSAFPKQKDTWYSLIVDDSYSKEQVDKIMDDLVNETKKEVGLEVEGLSLKESMALAKATASSHKFTKKYTADYLRGKEDVEVNERGNFTSTGLPLADTHYVTKGNKKKCFAYIYETEGSIILLAKMKGDYANELKKNHTQVNLSAFPKQKDTWYSLIIDDSYTNTDFEKIMDHLIDETKGEI